MSDVVIRVADLWKQYRIGARDEARTFRELLNNSVMMPFRAVRSLVSGNGAGKRRSASETFWALKGVSFEVQQGEVLGVIGRNGAGKSTLLKVLSRITDPTRGRVEIRGRVGSLLEVGTGFHPELTGRENVYLNGAILGMRKAEIESKFDEIVAFAEVEKFIDTPVKYFSSGMYLRLAFAVAAHLEPEILIVDEVLAVGDSSFQKKCLGKMGEVAKQGRTVLFVSHNMTAVQSLCDRAIWLSSGEMTTDGEAGTVVARYLQQNAVARTESLWPDPETAPGNHEVRFHRARLVPGTREASDPITVETPLELEFLYWNLAPGATLSLSLVLYNIEEVCIFNTTSASTRREAGLVREVCEVPANLLNDGTYRVRLLVVKDGSRALLDLPDMLSFEVADVKRQGSWHGKWIGTVRPRLQWRSETISAEKEKVSQGASLA